MDGVWIVETGLSSTVVGHETTEEVRLFNHESIPLHFSFDATTLLLPCHSSQVCVAPMSGWLQPNSSQLVTLGFCPQSDKEVNFNISCVIKRKAQPLTLNVKAEGYSMNCVVLCEDSLGSKVELKTHSLNTINFGEVRIHHAVTHP